MLFYFIFILFSGGTCVHIIVAGYLYGGTCGRGTSGIWKESMYGDFFFPALYRLVNGKCAINYVK